jgi:hypothetical protein
MECIDYYIWLGFYVYIVAFCSTFNLAALGFPRRERLASFLAPIGLLTSLGFLGIAGFFAEFTSNLGSLTSFYLNYFYLTFFASFALAVIEISYFFRGTFL